MEHQLLQRFNGDKHTKDALIAYLKEYFEQQIVDLAYKGEDVYPTAEAVLVMVKAFEQLEIDFGIKEKQNENTNQAR